MTQPPHATPSSLPDTAKTRAWVTHGEILGGRFEVDEFVGAGGTSSVFTCKDRALRSAAAVKLLTDPTADARRRFLDEGRILANLRHPHLVQVLAVGETDHAVPYIVLELLAGRSLQARLDREGPLPWRDTAEILAQVAGALAALHQAGVIHRDIKPANIVQVDSATGRPLVKLIDLGVAKVDAWERVQTGGFTPSPRHQTEVGLVVGTPGFCPPEASYVPPDPRFDTYALGVTLYLLCTGEMPRPGEVRPVNDVRPGCGAPPEFEALLASALALLPDDRIATAAEFQRRLEEIRGAHTETASPVLFDGCYELIELLGAGAHAEVYRAYHRDMACYVALKLPKASALGYAEQRRRLAVEARVLSAVRHPALPGLIDCRTSEQRQQPYIAMDLATGASAQPHCIGKNILKPAEVIAVGRCLAGALASLHAHGIVHRDVHAGNVLIDFGRETTATLIDVGMAELGDRYYAVVPQRYPTPPEGRAKLGTGGLEHLEWTAPEARAQKVWIPKSDVYSLGLLLYRLLTGKRPVKVGTGELIPPRTYVSSCPVALGSALMAALHADPAQRVDARGLLAKLDAAADELADDHAPQADREDAKQPDEPVPPPPNVRAGRPPRRWGWPTVTGALGVTLGVAVCWGMSPSPPRADPPTAIAADDPPTTSPPNLKVPAYGQPRSTPPVLAAAVQPRLPGLHDALVGASTELRRCSGLAGGLLVVAYKVADGDDFASVTVDGKTTPAVERCVRDATANLRFQPQGPQSFTEEYTP